MASARGTFTADVTATANGATLAWEMTFSGLTGNANAAHIHTAARGTAGPVSVPLCGSCQSPASGTDILEYRGDKIARESIYVSDGWDPPEWRAGAVEGRALAVPGASALSSVYVASPT